MRLLGASFSLLASVLLLARDAAAWNTWNEEWACLEGVSAVVTYMGYAALDYESACVDDKLLASFMDCMYTNSPKKVNSIWSWMTYECGDYGLVTNETLLKYIYENATETGWIVQLDTLTPGETVDAPVTVNQTIYEESLKYYKVLYGEINNGTWMGEGMIGYWCLVMLVGIIWSLANRIAPNAMINVKMNFVRKHVVLPATAGKKHSKPLALLGFVPTRVQSLIVFFHCLLNLLLISIGYHRYYPNIYDVSMREQAVVFLSHRTGLIAFAQIPLVFLFASRNNLLIWATGWSFDTFNVYHRWISRTMFINALIHSVCWTIDGIDGDYLASDFLEPYWIYGVLATAIAGVMVGLAWQVLRHWTYEIFLAIHIFLAVFFIVGCYVHVNIDEFGYTEWLKVSIALWCFDRLVRFVRIGLNGGLLKTPFELRGKDVFRARIKQSKTWAFFPGAHVFVYVMVPTGFWESHPFTVFQSNLPGEEDSIILLAKTHKGITKTIANRLTKGGGTGDLRVFVEGPYGHHHPVEKFGTVLLIAGGIGVTAILSYAQQLKQFNKSGQHVIVRWVVHDEDALAWIPHELEQLLGGASKIDFEIYMTTARNAGGNAGNKDKLDESDEKSSDEENFDARRITEITYRRPEMEEVVGEVISAANGSVAVLVCGPPAMNDDVRASVVRHMEAAPGKVEYFEEAFAW
ncbi:ferric reductase like transmembrane component-domain-containing protein [Limtongia smithiae]|uniref:ferric reductase like transmembrane component-domain-containing protein n=1 Tax=Limtongia smithiae TaxID=1125753 RepID=UPI0034CDD852